MCMGECVCVCIVFVGVCFMCVYGVCVYVCMYVCMYVCVCVCVFDCFAFGIITCVLRDCCFVMFITFP